MEIRIGEKCHMKFCYLDESGLGQKTVFIMVGVIVDAYKMRRTKTEFSELFDKIQWHANKTIREIHAKELVPGNGSWRGVELKQRCQVVDEILDWYKERKHKVTFSAIDTNKFLQLPDNNVWKSDLKKVEIAAAFHIVLSLQRAHQKIKKEKGHTLLVFDKGKEPPTLVDLIVNPPRWTDSYCDFGDNQSKERLDQIIDVPYYADSHQVALIQIADLVCYILRQYSELEDYDGKEKRGVDFDHYKRWVQKIKEMCITPSHRYKTRKACDTSKFFTELAPVSLKKL